MYEPGVVQRSGNTVNVNGARSIGRQRHHRRHRGQREHQSQPDEQHLPPATRTTCRSSRSPPRIPRAEEGRNSGANVSIATRSGTNQIHGTAFEFFRNTALNAKEFYANAQGCAKPIIQLNQYGFEVGGPIRKNKTFFFGSWQGQKVNFADPIDKDFRHGRPLHPRRARPASTATSWCDPDHPVVDQRPAHHAEHAAAGRSADRRAGPRRAQLRQPPPMPIASPATTSSPTIPLDRARFRRESRARRLSGAQLLHRRRRSQYRRLSVEHALPGARSAVPGPHRSHDQLQAHAFLAATWAASRTRSTAIRSTAARIVIPGYPGARRSLPPGHQHRGRLPQRSHAARGQRTDARLSRAGTFLFTQGEANPLFPNTPRFTFNNSDVDYTANPRTYRAPSTRRRSSTT